MITRLSSSVKLVDFQSLDVFAHRHFGWHPVVGASVEVMLPCPFIFEGHELVDIDACAVDQPFFSDLTRFSCPSQGFFVSS